MKKEPQIEEGRGFEVYPLVVSVVTGVAIIFTTILAVMNFRFGWRIGVVDYAMIGLVSLAVTRMAMAGASRGKRWRLVAAGGSGLALCVALGWWVFHVSNFELTASSYQALNAAKVPADLIAELKNAEGSVDETEQQFVADLNGRFGQDHIAPYRETLVQSGWKVHRRMALGALLGFCLCFSLTVGAALAPRARDVIPSQWRVERDGRFQS